MKTLEDALQLALDVHTGQVDKHGAPYILHPIRVMCRMTTPTEQMVALLHDVVEDSDLTTADLTAQGYPPDVVAAVDHVSRRPDESYEAFTRRIKPHPLARRVKLGDLEDNMDLRRLPLPLSEKDMARLQRYRRAWAILTDEEA